METCRNCGQDAVVSFCSNCGEKKYKRLDVGFLGLFFTNFFNVNGRFFFTLRYLLFNPSKLASFFIDGKRLQVIDPARLTLFAYTLLGLLSFYESFYGSDFDYIFVFLFPSVAINYLFPVQKGYNWVEKLVAGLYLNVSLIFWSIPIFVLTVIFQRGPDILVATLLLAYFFAVPVTIVYVFFRKFGVGKRMLTVLLWLVVWYLIVFGLFVDFTLHTD